MKPRTRKNRETQQRIADCLRRGIPLAGLISSLVTATGCDLFHPKVVGKMVPAGDIAPEQKEECVVTGDMIAEPEAPKDDAQPKDKGECNGNDNGDVKPQNTTLPPLAGAPLPPVKEKEMPEPPLAGKPAPVNK